MVIYAGQGHLAAREGKVCKTVGFAYPGSNPGPATRFPRSGPWHTRCTGGPTRNGSGPRHCSHCLLAGVSAGQRQRLVPETAAVRTGGVNMGCGFRVFVFRVLSARSARVRPARLTSRWRQCRGTTRCYRPRYLDDQAAPLHEQGSAAVDDHGADGSAVLADPTRRSTAVRW
jgi:hypothetical protein